MDGWQGPILCPISLPICCCDFSDIDNSIICLCHLQTFLGVHQSEIKKDAWKGPKVELTLPPWARTLFWRLPHFWRFNPWLRTWRRAGAQSGAHPHPQFFCNQVFFVYDPSTSTRLLSSVMDQQRTTNLTLYHNSEYRTTLEDVLYFGADLDSQLKYLGTSSHNIFPYLSLASRSLLCSKSMT